MKNLESCLPNSELSHGTCPHVASHCPGGLALIAIGNTLRADDGIASVLCQNLDSELRKSVCYFDLGTFTAQLPHCVNSHKTSIVVDSTKGGLAAGSVSILNLNDIIGGGSEVCTDSSHGFSFVDELKLIALRQELPGRLIFFGVEGASCDWSERLSPCLENMLPDLAAALSKLISATLEELRDNA